MSNTFKPSIPQPSDPQDVSQGDLLANNQSLQYVYGIDHWPLFPSSANDGFHEQVTLPTFPNSIGALPAQPSAITPSLRLFSQIVASVPTLFGISSASATPFPIGSVAVNANPGSLQLGSVLIKWGSVLATAANGTTTATYDTTTPFAAAPYVTLVSIGQPIAQPFGVFGAVNTYVTGTPTTTLGINYAQAGNNFPIYYVAIGSA